jgi:hypothetical protein
MCVYYVLLTQQQFSLTKAVALRSKQWELTDEDADDLILYFKGELSVRDACAKEINGRKKLEDGWEYEQKYSPLNFSCLLH